MRRLYRAAALAVLAAASIAAHAQDNGPSTRSEMPAAPESAASAVGAPAAASKFEGALGLVLTHKPDYSGSSERKFSPQLAGFVRYGRFTLTGAGGFTTRRNDDVERGLDAELVRREGLRVDLALRFDPGRRESESVQLAGMGDIDPTIRTRLGVRWQPVPRWQLSLGASLDSLGRGGGYTIDAGVSRTFQIDGRQRVVLGAGASGAGDRYLQTWYGVSDDQALASGYPAYRPSEGLRDVHASATWRIEYNPQWAGFTPLNVGRLLGAAADSPLTHQRSSVSLSAGIARRF
jgi:outer membrane protein